MSYELYDVLSGGRQQYILSSESLDGVVDFVARYLTTAKPGNIEGLPRLVLCGRHNNRCTYLHIQTDGKGMCTLRTWLLYHSEPPNVQQLIDRIKFQAAGRTK